MLCPLYPVYTKIILWQYLPYGKKYTILQNMNWDVKFSKKACKQLKKLPVKVQTIVQLLVTEMILKGPNLHGWPNYGKLKAKKSKDLFHCHLIKGKPTYVACWEIVDKKCKFIEVIYVGTHENAKY